VKPAVIYILGTGHSGSTILQYLLAGRPNIIGLGEVRQLTDRRNWRQGLVEPCSCGAAVETCSLWGDLEPVAAELSVDWYKRVLSKVSILYPGTTHLVDSSKSTKSIHPWLKLLDEDLISGIHALYLVRDVRGWAVSDETTRKRKGRPPQPLFLSMVDWWKNQKLFLRFLKTNEKNIAFLTVSYESLIFRTDAQLSRIADFVGINGDQFNWEDGLKKAVVHDVWGNRMKNDFSTRSRLTYDDRWQYRMSASLPAILLFPIWRMNQKLRRDGGLI